MKRQTTLNEKTKQRKKVMTPIGRIVIPMTELLLICVIGAFFCNEVGIIEIPIETLIPIIDAGIVICIGMLVLMYRTSLFFKVEQST